MTWEILQGDALEVLKVLDSDSVDCVVTSPPYWTMIDYQAAGQLGLEPTMEEHLDKLSEVLGEVRRVLRRGGTLWLNYADCYNTCNGGPGPGAGRQWMRKRARMPKLRTGFGLKTRQAKRKSLLGLPWRLALRLEADGWYLRSSVIWRKPNPMENSLLDRPKKAHEYVFLLAKSKKYFFRGPMESVWEISALPVRGHPAPFPPELAERCILAGSKPGDLVLDPFAGAGTTLLAALRHGRRALGIELNPEYSELARRRIVADAPLFNSVLTT